MITSPFQTSILSHDLLNGRPVYKKVSPVMRQPGDGLLGESDQGQMWNYLNTMYPGAQRSDLQALGQGQVALANQRRQQSLNQAFNLTGSYNPNMPNQQPNVVGRR